MENPGGTFCWKIPSSLAEVLPKVTPQAVTPLKPKNHFPGELLVLLCWGPWALSCSHTQKSWIPGGVMGDLGTEVSQCSSVLSTICLSLWDFPWSVLVKLNQSFRGFLENFGWKAGALQRDRLRAEAQLHQGQCWLVTEGDKCPYHYLLELLLACLQSPVESQTSTL